MKVFIGTLGAVVVLIGIALIPLPGPGWAIVVLGLAIWAIEFVWAKHLLRFTRKRLSKWTHWVARQSLPVRALIGALGLVFINVVIWLSVRMTFHIDLFDICRDFVVGR